MATSLIEITQRMTPNQLEKLKAKGVTRLQVLSGVQGIAGWVVEYTRKGKNASFQIQKNEKTSDMVYMYVMRNIAANENEEV